MDLREEQQNSISQVSVRGSTAAARIVEQLREALLSGQLEPGEARRNLLYDALQRRDTT